MPNLLRGGTGLQGSLQGSEAEADIDLCYRRALDALRELEAAARRTERSLSLTREARGQREFPATLDSQENRESYANPVNMGLRKQRDLTQSEWALIVERRRFNGLSPDGYVVDRDD